MEPDHSKLSTSSSTSFLLLILRFDNDCGCGRLIDDKPKDIWPTVVADHIEVELSAANLVEIEGRGQDGFALEIGAGQHLAERADNGASTPHQYRVRRVAKRDAHGLGKIPLANELA